MKGNNNKTICLTNEKNKLKKLLTELSLSDKIRKSLEGDEENWSLKIEQI